MIRRTPYRSVVIAAVMASILFFSGFTADGRETAVFNSAKDWNPHDSSPYKVGLISVKAPKVPMTFEQTVYPETGVAEIDVSRGTGMVDLANHWLRPIRFDADSFQINGQTYTVPKAYRKQKIMLLPIDKGIVWAPVNQRSYVMDQPQALVGNTDIFYTPYQRHGGSLAKGMRRIAKLPHRWMGIDGPVIASAWTGWLPKNQVRMANVKSDTVYHLQFKNGGQEGQLKSVTPVTGVVQGWPTFFKQDLSKKTYYQKPHYAAYVGEMTRTLGGFVLGVGLIDETHTGRNAGIGYVNYYWSEKTGKWTPLNQSYTVQTLGGKTDIGSDGVYWEQPLPVGIQSNDLDVAEMRFDPATLSIESIWLGNWVIDSFADGSSWVTVLYNDMPAANENPKKWTVYTPKSPS